MIVGIDKFREHFAGFEEQYAIIGGTACDLIFDQAGLGFRATKDIDMVLCVEMVDIAFAECFRTFLDAGGYEARERCNGRKEFYRFHRPSDHGFPYMIELFSRNPDALKFREGDDLASVFVEEDVISLSAILLDEDYYEALQKNKHTVDGVTIIDETLLIPFKARAFLDLSARAEKGEKVKSKDIKKHRNDVFRLAQLLPGNASFEVPKRIQKDLQQFLDLIEAEGELDPKAFKVPLTREEAITLLRSAYRIK
ncbi:MAG: hypothetical protein DRR42_26255 [Gammaproteobacteria bacterium]|nr:MAG: hypothetical protein DRR42_26255 [Gammaproteobacteria bacterium]